MKKNLLLFIIIFLAVNLVFNFFFKQQNNTSEVKNEVILSMTKNDFGVGDTVDIEIKNNTAQVATFKNTCPEQPFEVLYLKNGNWIDKKHHAEISCDNGADYIVKPGEKITVSYGSWNHALFSEVGKYKIRANTMESKMLESHEFEIKPQGTFGYLWTTLFYQPLYNVLIFFINIAPGHDLGAGIILLTIFIRTVLLLPSQNALRSQRKMQELQPKLNKIKEKYKDNQEMMTKETYATWKEHKVNPFGSCLPLLIQFPVLIALYHVVQNGLNPDNSYLLYGSLKNFSYAGIHVNFLNILDLTKINLYILPLLVGGLQFLQMKLAMIRSKTTNRPSRSEANTGTRPGGASLASEKNVAIKDDKQKAAGNEMEMANKMMIYFMPGMIAVFTASVPAGIGLYWCVSTIYGIAQQLVVNYQADSQKSKVTVLNS